MTGERQGELARLRETYGDKWEIWVVHRVYGGPVYCARRHDNHRKVLNAGSAGELEVAMQDAEGEQ